MCTMSYLSKKKKKECVLWVGLVTCRHATVMTHLYVCKKKKKKEKKRSSQVGLVYEDLQL